MALPNPRTAVRSALASYLATNLASAWPTLVVSESWPTPQKIFPPVAMTVLAPESGELVEYHQPVVWQTNVASDGSATVVYSYGKLQLPLQIDAWAGFGATRDDLIADVLPLLNRDPAATLGVTQTAALAQAPGLVLPLPSYAGVTAEYAFDPLPRLEEAAQAAMVSQWRATWTGTATVYLMQSETQPVMRDVTIKMGLNGDSPTDVAPYSYQGYVLADAPCLYWRMGDAVNSTTVADISGNSFSGAVTGALTFGSTGLLRADPATCAAASAAGVKVVHSGDLAVGSAFSVEWWIKPSALTAGGNDIGQAFGVFYCKQNADGSLNVGTTNAITTAAGTYAVGKTTHCCFTYDGTTGRFYANGQLVNSAAMPAPSGPLNAFGFAVTGPWQGSVQEIAVYRAALPAARVLAHYYLGSVGP